MCIGKGCGQREKCYRYRAIPDKMNNYFEPYLTDPSYCDYFLPIKGQKIRRLDECPKEGCCSQCGYLESEIIFCSTCNKKMEKEHV